MANEPDLSRARQLTRLALAELDGLRQRQSVCGDADLRSTLQDIGARKSKQAWHLLEWLQRHDGDNGAEQSAKPPAAKEPDDAGKPAESESAISAPQAPASGQPQSPATREQAPVIERRDITEDLIVFRVARPEGFEFSPGQSVKAGIGDIRRAYSIVSAPHEPFLEFFVELAPGGQMSEKLRRLQVGDTLALGTPKGGLRFEKGVQQHLMIATVTGINPFISMIRDYLHHGQRGHRIVLMHGASYQDEFGYREELEKLAAAHPEQLTYLPTVSRPGEPRNQLWTGQQGRVDTLVDEIVNSHSLDPQDTQVYACGHSGMLESVAGQVQSLGFRLETENYD